MKSDPCERTGGVGFCALMPHAPVLVPAVGGDRCREVAATIDAMRQVSKLAVDSRPSLLVLVSPHAPRRPRSFGIWSANRLRGSLARFRAPEARVDLPVALDFVPALRARARDESLSTWLIEESEEPLDHGAVVPLWFLVEAGWSGPTVVVSLDYPGDDGCIPMGRALRAAASAFDGPIAVIASGDMSHALKPGAPADFHPSGPLFDRTFIEKLREGGGAALDAIDIRLRDEAAEDAWDSARLALAAAGDRDTGHRVLSYEGTFGVGYGVAVLFSARAAPLLEDEWSGLALLARRSVENALGRARHPAPDHPGGLLAQARAVFVTIHDGDGELRGCIGALAPQYGSVAEEVWHFARQAAFHDPRFPPVASSELDNLSFEVSVLDPPEPVASEADLDARRYGVVVRGSGNRRGVLLPDIPGVDTVAEQVSIARRKGRLGEREPVSLERFVVRKIAEA